jgi:hypothetical protein
VRGFDGELGEKSSHCGGRKHVVYCHILHGTPGHTRIQRAIQTLNQRHTALLLDREQTSGAVVQVAREDDSNNSRPELMRGGSEEGVNGGAVAILFGSSGEANPAVVQMKMPIGRSDVDAAGLDQLPIPGVPRG